MRKRDAIKKGYEKAVADLEKSLAFYRDGLGLPPKGIVDTEYEGGAASFLTR